MAIVDPTLCGRYLGLKKVREGREAELAVKERKEIQKAKPSIDLELRADGSFQRQLTTGTWEVDGNAVTFHPELFGGESFEDMKRKAEAMGRMFGLAFVFDPFVLHREGNALVTPDEGSAIYTEFRTDWEL